MSRPNRSRLALAAALALAAPRASGGEAPHGGHERVIVVANGASVLSLSLARRYAELRRIPAEHVVVLDDVPGGGPASAEPISFGDCRDRILAPILARLAERGLTDEIDAIVYSTGFPHAVDFSAAAQDRRLAQYTGSVAALTGMTYFARDVLANDLDCLALDANRYCKSPTGAARERAATADEAKLWEQAQQALREKKHAEAEQALRELSRSYAESASVWYDLACCEALLGKRDDALATLAKAVAAGFWNADHAAADADLTTLRGDAAFDALLAKMRQRVPRPQPSRGFGCDPQGRGRHYLSTLLAWVGPFGLPYGDAIASLERSAAADATDPRGTFYFLRNGDVRATTRAPLFASALLELEQRGRAAEVLEPGRDGQDGILPKGRKDVLGAMVGISDFDWSASGSTILPGAIVEHLTSCGGMFQAAGQTKLTAFLQAGAAGASGAVVEPYAIQAKFPTPFVHVHYADGCSLAEAFFQSVAGPYQLLIVGDACCRPFARLGTLELPAGAGKEPWQGSVALEVVARAAAGRGDEPTAAVERIEAWIDGRRVAAGPPGAPLAIDTTGADDGPHALHVVAVAAPPIASAWSIERRIVIANGAAKVTASGSTRPIDLGGRVVLQGRAPFGARVDVLEGERELARAVATGGAWRVELPAIALGLGRVELVARATAAGAAGGSGRATRSDPVVATIVAPKLTTKADAPGDLLPGLAIDVDGGGGGGAKTRLLGMLRLGDELPVAAASDDAPRARVTVRGWIELAASGLHEWGVQRGALRALTLDGKKLVADTAAEGCASGSSFAAEALAGWHSLELEFEPTSRAAPRLWLLAPSGPATTALVNVGSGPAGMKRVEKDRLKAAVTGWMDGDVGQPHPPATARTAEIEFASGRSEVVAVAAFLAGAPALRAEELAEALVAETRDAGGWSALPREGLRVFGGAGSWAAAVVWAGAGRRARQLRLREAERAAGVLAGLAEVGIWEARPGR